jgi:hypothetical protein
MAADLGDRIASLIWGARGRSGLSAQCDPGPRGRLQCPHFDTRVEGGDAVVGAIAEIHSGNVRSAFTNHQSTVT